MCVTMLSSSSPSLHDGDDGDAQHSMPAPHLWPCFALSGLQSVVDELQAAGVAQLDNGAMCVFVEGKEVPLIVQKSDGGFGYASTDMAALKQRVFDEKADWVIYVTDLGQVGPAPRASRLPPSLRGT